MHDVLIVDDNADACKPLARLLGHLHVRALCIETGPHALEYLKTHHPRLIILDVMMPIMDGLEVLAQIRDNPQTSSIPVVMFSASGDPETIARAKTLGARDYWIKNKVDFGELRRRVATYLDAPESVSSKA